MILLDGQFEILLVSVNIALIEIGEDGTEGERLLSTSQRPSCGLNFENIFTVPLTLPMIQENGTKAFVG